MTMAASNKENETTDVMLNSVVHTGGPMLAATRAD
jgi:hypothetical protein